MSLLPALDQNEESIVVTQAIGHWLYVLLPHHIAPPLHLRVTPPRLQLLPVGSPRIPRSHAHAA